MNIWSRVFLHLHWVLVRISAEAHCSSTVLRAHCTPVLYCTLYTVHSLCSADHRGLSPGCRPPSPSVHWSRPDTFCKWKLCITHHTLLTYKLFYCLSHILMFSVLHRYFSFSQFNNETIIMYVGDKYHPSVITECAWCLYSDHSYMWSRPGETGDLSWSRPRPHRGQCHAGSETNQWTLPLDTQLRP